VKVEAFGADRTGCVRSARRRRSHPEGRQLVPLSKDGFKHCAIDELWRVKAAISAKSIGTAITSDTVIEQIRKELRR
jgi:hypothetical protein